MKEANKSKQINPFGLSSYIYVYNSETSRFCFIVNIVAEDITLEYIVGSRSVRFVLPGTKCLISYSLSNSKVSHYFIAPS